MNLPQAATGEKYSNHRLHALDAVRGTALLLGLVLHSTMSFIVPIPVADNSPSTALAVIFYVIHIFRMAVFYFIAGFFARMVFHRRGLKHFVRDRAKRIGIPLVAGWFIIAPPTIVIVIWGLIRTFGLETIQSSGEQSQGGFPWTHLWFLYYLCIFYLLALLLHWFISRVVDRSERLRTFIDRFVAFAVSFNFIPVLLAAPICLWLYHSDNWILWTGIPTPDTGITPQAAAMMGFGTAFGIGWILHRQVSLLSVFKKYWQLNLAIAIVMTAYCLSLVGLSSVILTTVTVIGLVSYQHFVRATFIGKLLNGRRYPKTRVPAIRGT